MKLANANIFYTFKIQELKYTKL